MSATTLSIGPGAIAAAGVDGGPAFTLARPQWVAIQVYCTDAQALPTTEEAFRNSLGPGAPKDLSDFTQLISAYELINAHTTTWTETTFPATVELASDVYQYGMNKVPVFYPPILTEARALEANPNDKRAKDALKAILDNVQASADQRAAKATEVLGKVRQFSTDTGADKVTLVGTDGKAGLVKYYADRYGEQSAEVARLTKEIEAQRLVLKQADEEYDHDVIVASTTPTYAWIWPIGTIAGAVVAGVYGKRATDALARSRAAQEKINSLAADLAADANLMVAIQSASLGMNTIARDISDALPVLQQIEGVWGGIAADLKSISKLIDEDIRKVPPVIMSLGVDEAVRAWQMVARNADAYRANAFVKDVSPHTSMAAWKLARQLRGTAEAA